MGLDGPINRDAFSAYVHQRLVPERQPGDGVIMDTASAKPIRSSHKGPAIHDAIKAAGGVLLFLPPLDQVEGRLYSPAFNPIEQAFAKLKAHLRTAALRSIHGPWRAIGRILGLYSPQECAHDFANAAYDPD